MKKFTVLVLLFLFITNKSYGNTREIGNGLQITIPNNYKYFEITFKQLASRFPNFASDDEIYTILGIGKDSKLIVVANNYKTINFFDDLTSINGIEKLNRNHLQPFIQKFSDPKLAEMLVKDLQKTFPNKNFDTMSEEEIMENLFELMQNPKMVKKYERFGNKFKKKFNKEYNLQNYTVILLGDTKAEIIDEINIKKSDELVKEVKAFLNEIYETSKETSLLGLRDFKFEINKNNNGDYYFYSNDNLNDPFLPLKYNQEIFFTSHEDKIVMLLSICSKNCKGSTDLQNIIKTTNLFVNKDAPKQKSFTINSDVAVELEKLDNLYKSGALTKEEYIKAKKVILD